MSSAMPELSMNAVYASVVIANPGGTGIPAVVSATREAHLPPSSSIGAGPVSSKKRMNRRHLTCQASQVTGTEVGTRNERFSPNAMGAPVRRMLGTAAAVSSSTMRSWSLASMLPRQ